MKKTLFVLAMVLVIAGCKKDKDNPNYIKYDGKEYALSQGMIENWGLGWEDEGYNLDISLLSSGFSISDAASVSGTGHGIYLWMYSSNSAYLESGTYHFDAEATEVAGTFEDGNAFVNLNVLAMTADINNDIASGTVTVTRNGSAYTIDINCIDEDNKAVAGHFEGTLRYFNHDSNKSTKTKRF